MFFFNETCTAGLNHLKKCIDSRSASLKCGDGGRLRKARGDKEVAPMKRMGGGGVEHLNKEMHSCPKCISY